MADKLADRYKAIMQSVKPQEKTPCGKCDGTGTISHRYGNGISVEVKEEDCPHCKGTGYEPEPETGKQ
jgi:DnaJ-class molecular chaperone